MTVAAYSFEKSLRGERADEYEPTVNVPLQVYPEWIARTVNLAIDVANGVTPQSVLDAAMERAFVRRKA